MANTTFAAPAYPAELGQRVTHILNPTIPQSGITVANAGKTPSTSSASASVITTTRQTNPAQQAITNVKGG